MSDNGIDTVQGNTRKPSVTILIGLPRSGKTTYANHLKGSVPIISADQLRYLVYGQRFWGNGEPMVWAIRGVALRMLMEQGIDIIIDETNTTKARRSEIIKLARKYDYDVIGVWIDTPESECIGRAIAEGDEVIIPAIKRMAEQFEEPEKSEFDCLLKLPINDLAIT